MFIQPGKATDELDTLTERCLVRASLAGDHEAFSKLVVHHQDRLYRAMLRLTHSSDLSEDLVQDAFVQAYQKLDQFAERCRFYTWLFRIAFNRYLVLRRRRKPMASLEALQDKSSLHPIDASDSAEHACMRAETRGQVGQALERLDQQSRRILIMREMKGLSYEQIGETLEIKLGTVRSRLSRARAKLANELAQSSEFAELQ